MGSVKQKILFIINPISGVGKQKTIEKLIESELDHTQFEVSIEYTKTAKHAITIKRRIMGTSWKTVVNLGLTHFQVFETCMSYVQYFSFFVFCCCGFLTTDSYNILVEMRIDK